MFYDKYITQLHKKYQPDITLVNRHGKKNKRDLQSR